MFFCVPVSISASNLFTKKYACLPKIGASLMKPELYYMKAHYCV